MPQAAVGGTQSGPAALGRGRLLLGCAAFVVIGCAAMVYIQGSGLTSPYKYHTDLTQSPNWIAYHGDAFAKDDLLVEYGRYNESPIQNAIYWLGTWLVDVVRLNKLVGIAIFGLTAALFFGLVAQSGGALAAVLAAAFFVIVPRSTYEIAGGFSKGWAIAFVLLAIHIIEAKRCRMLLWVMPLAALAYPIAPVMIGAIVLVGVLLELRRDRDEAFAAFKWLIAGSALALAPLLYKYLTPPARIGQMVSTEKLKSLWAINYSEPFLLPLWREAVSYLERPFIYGAVIVIVLLARHGVIWKRSWSALVIASSVCYYVADLVAPRLYVPDRYTRFSMAVLLVLFFAYNWARALELVRVRWLRRAAAAALIALSALSFHQTFRPCAGNKSQGVWQNKEIYTGLSAAIAALPQPVLVAGHPYHSAEVMVQARRPVLVVNRMFHDWYVDYRKEMEQRIRQTFTALYGKNPVQVNEIAERYGVTHLIVDKRQYAGTMLRRGRVYKREFRALIAGLALRQGDFVLKPPPKDSILYEDRYFYLIRLPLR